jgi:hypothetical protein
MDRFYVFELFGLDGPCTVKARSCGELLAKLLDTLAARLAEMPGACSSAASVTTGPRGGRSGSTAGSAAS